MQKASVESYPCVFANDHYSDLTLHTSIDNAGRVIYRISPQCGSWSSKEWHSVRQTIQKLVYVGVDDGPRVRGPRGVPRTREALLESGVTVIEFDGLGHDVSEPALSTRVLPASSGGSTATSGRAGDRDPELVNARSTNSAGSAR